MSWEVILYGDTEPRQIFIVLPTADLDPAACVVEEYSGCKLDSIELAVTNSSLWDGVDI